MKLNIAFDATVVIHSLGKNYSGRIAFFPEPGDTETYYFLSLNPFGGPAAELSICRDEEMTEVVADLLGKDYSGLNRQLERFVTKYEIQSVANHGLRSLIFVLINLIAFAIVQTEKEAKKAKAMWDGRLENWSFQSVWEQEIKGEDEKLAKQFVETFGLY